nr:hypothetical protein B0A51_18340 [Rachicladosporium sp. CCFEE 5018]
MANLEVIEHDDAGNITVTYVESTNDQGNARVDLVRPLQTKSLLQRTLDVFLPAGYPHSVTNDYFEYQVYDSLQAFSSSIAGLLSSRAVLSSVGVGDATASPTAALLLSVVEQSVGRVITILFAYRFGTSLEPECKMYRLLADVLNDFAFVLDCLSPAFPKPLRVLVLTFAGVLRALCGVAAGSSKASLSAHFAKWGNLGELNAKDSSQETVISLLGMLVGSQVVTYVTSPMPTWTTLMLLLAVHLETNRRAVRAVSMRTLNRQRAGIIYHHLRGGHVPSPEEVAHTEWIFEWDGVMRRADGSLLGHCTVGASISDLLSSIASTHSSTKSTTLGSISLTKLLLPFATEKYILWYEPRTIGRQLKVSIALKQGAECIDIIAAWWHAIAMSETVTGLSTGNAEDEGGLSVLEKTMRDVDQLLQKHRKPLEDLGWDLKTGALETRSGRRLDVRKL